MTPLKIVFMGTPDFAVPSLRQLVRDGHDIVGVVTATDKKGGRGMKQTIESAVKKAALEMDLPILQPARLKNPNFIAALRAMNADLFVVVAFRMLPEVVWNMPPKGTINLHGSLLPKYRGAAPIHWAVIRGEKQTGLTTFKIRHEIDTGDIIDQVIVPIHFEDTTGTLYQRMMETGAILLAKTVNRIASGPVTFSRQDPSLATSAPKLTHENTRIRFDQSATGVYNFIRGLNPWPLAWTTIDGVETKIISAEIAGDTASLSPGTIFLPGKGQLLIGTQDYPIQVKELKMAGKKKMDVKAFLNGYQIKTPSVE